MNLINYLSLKQIATFIFQLIPYFLINFLLFSFFHISKSILIIYNRKNLSIILKYFVIVLLNYRLILLLLYDHA